LHSSHCSREAGIPQTQVLLWVYGEQRRALLDNRVLAAYRCRYDGQAHKVTDIPAGTFYAPRFISPQEALIPLNPQESLVVYRPKAPRRRGLQRCSKPPWVLFALVSTGEPAIAGPQALCDGRPGASRGGARRGWLPDAYRHSSNASDDGWRRITNGPTGSSRGVIMRWCARCS
jgi:hypothetical protein